MTELAMQNILTVIDLALKGLESICDKQGIDLDNSAKYQSICNRLTAHEWGEEVLNDMEDWWELIDSIADLKASLFNR